MRISTLCLSVGMAIGFAVCSAAPVQAQILGQETRSDAEIALQKTLENRQLMRETRAENILECSVEKPEACYVAGEYTRKGWGGLQDYKGAEKYYRKGCISKHAASCATLGNMFNRDVLGEPNFGQARFFFEKACNYGDMSGCAGFGNLLFVGKGGRKDTVKGAQYLSRACDADYDWACDRIDALGAQDLDPDWRGEIGFYKR